MANAPENVCYFGKTGSEGRAVKVTRLTQLRHSPRRTVVVLDAGFRPIKEGVLAVENGATHFRDIDIEMSQVGPDGTTSKRLPATGVYFRTTPADWFFDWHPAIRRQYIVNLDAPHQVQASDGERRIIDAGEIYLVEDVCGKGHLSRGLGQFRRSLLLPID